MRAVRRWVGVGLAWWLAVLCAVPAVAATLLEFTPAELARIASHGPWPPAPRLDPSNRVDGQPGAIAFGRTLFFDPGLSANGRLSCAGCHSPGQGFQDGRVVALGLAPGVRNTPGLFDVGSQRWFGWDGAFDSLWAASLAPMLAAGEMGSRHETLAARVRGDAAPAGLGARYKAVFGVPGADEAVVVDLAKAMAAWLATLVSPRSPFDHFRDALLRGDKLAAARFPLDAQRGLRLFIGKANCVVCHAGPRFSNGEFADIGVPFFVPGGVDNGRHGGIQRLLASRYNRLGAFSDAPPGDASTTGTRHVLLEHRHFGEFRVPTLRGLLATAPYMHDGSLTTLEAVVTHYSALDEERLHADGERILRRLDLGAGEAADLAAFLRSLSAGPVPSVLGLH
jgi:cytochrome c peroxidase